VRPHVEHIGTEALWPLGRNIKKKNQHPHNSSSNNNNNNNKESFSLRRVVARQ
jgi:hypothetical protein